MTYQGMAVRGDVATSHTAQLFDELDSLADTVSAFLHQGFLNGEALLVVATSSHWEAIAERLRARDVPLDQAMQSGQLAVRDARELLQQFMRFGLPDRARFDRSIGGLVRQLGSGGRRVRIYGEMVDVLAAPGNFNGARELEDFWNELGERESFTLFCGYSAVTFGDPHSARALRAICDAHSHVSADPRDQLGSFLLRTHTGPADSTPAAR